MDFSMNNNYLEIIAQTSNLTSPVYREAAEATDKNTNKGVAYFKNFMSSIENLADKPQVKDTRIISSKGNIKRFQGYENIKTAISFLSKNLGNVNGVADCVKVYDALENWASLYEEGYTKGIRVIQLEYENAIFLLTACLSEMIATNMDVVANGSEIKLTKKSNPTHGVIQKTMKDLATQLGNRDHKDYLEGLIKVADESDKEDTKTESVASVADAVVQSVKLVGSFFSNAGKIFKSGSKLFTTIKKSLFGIVPLIRSIMYLRYKKKADTIVSLEEQIIFIERNIEQLKNIKTMDEKKKDVVIKKQQAAIETYKKKSAKLRAQLMETEKEAAEEAKKEEPELKNTSDELVLEATIFTEKASPAEKKKADQLRKSALMHKPKELSTKEVQRVRFDKKMDRFASVRHTEPAPIEKPADIEAKAKKAYEIFFNNTKKKSIRLVPGKGSKKDDDLSKRTDTKIGGNPYWPVSEKWPTTTIKGKTINMVCYAQLNLSKLPSIPGYPSKGLLQFFIADEEYWGASEPCKVIYRTSTSEKCITEYPRTTLNNTDDWSAIDEVYFPTATVEDQAMTVADDAYSDELCKAINEAFGTSYKTWSEIPKNVDEAFWKEYKKNDVYGCRIGGNPYFTQSDARSDHYSELLLQLDSEAGMMWGDCGVANFFISKADLDRKNFSDVYFTWDCY